jgi:hypothetical protein
MWRWLSFLLFALFLLGGIVAIWLGIVIELEVQYEIGNWEGAANQFYGGEIREYREQVFICLIAGPAALFAAYLLRPRFRSDAEGGRTKKTEPWSNR